MNTAKEHGMDYHEALNRFVAELKTTSDADYAQNFPNQIPCDFEIHSGKNYDKIVKVRHTNYGTSTQRSVHSFVVRRPAKTKALGQTKVGDIHKAASWSGPAKGARGTIFTDNPSEYNCNIYGANYTKYKNRYTQVGTRPTPLPR